MKTFFLGAFIAAVLINPLWAADSSHVGLVSYEGPKTCAVCHPEAAKEVAMSLHYQMAEEPRFLDGWPKGKKAGMMFSY
jgi:hypothetical protein